MTAQMIDAKKLDLYDYALKLKNDPEIHRFLLHTRKVGLHFEGGYIAAVMHKGAFFSAGTDLAQLHKELYYPKDDVEMTLAILHRFCQDQGTFRDVFARKHALVLSRFEFIFDVAGFIKSIYDSERDQIDEDEDVPFLWPECKIQYVRKCFAYAFMNNRCVSLPDKTITVDGPPRFFDPSGRAEFEIGGFSVLSLLWDVGNGVEPAVFYKLRKNNCARVADFICVMPNCVQDEHRFLKVTLKKIRVGPLLWKRIKLMDIADIRGGANDSMIKIIDYDPNTSLMRVRCQAESEERIMKFLAEQMKIIVDQLAIRRERQYFLERYKQMAMIGPGLEILHFAPNGVLRNHKKGLAAMCLKPMPPQDPLTTKEPCRICREDAEPNDFLRFSICGHVYCCGCALHMIQAAENFPIRCVGEHCAGTITYDDIDRVLGRAFRTSDELALLLKTVMGKSLQRFLRSNEHGLRKCLHDDCEGILKAPTLLHITPLDAQRSTRVIQECAECKMMRCALCGYDGHEGLTCAENYKENVAFTDPSINLWRMEDPLNHNFCPGCRSFIEKTDGCDHMQCTQCKIHFCWTCHFMAPTGREVIVHMNGDLHRQNELERLMQAHGHFGGQVDAMRWLFNRDQQDLEPDDIEFWNLANGGHPQIWPGDGFFA